MTTPLRQIGRNAYATADGRWRIDYRRGRRGPKAYYICDPDRRHNKYEARYFARVETRDMIDRAIDDYLQRVAAAALMGGRIKPSVRIYRATGVRR